MATTTSPARLKRAPAPRTESKAEPASTISAGPASAAGLLRLRTRTAGGLRDAVRKGLPFSALEAVIASLQLTLLEAGPILAIPLRTIARRKESGQLAPEESDRLYRLARTAAQAVEVLGDLDRARIWLKTPNRALGGEQPLGLLDTDIGARQVEEVLMRVNYGVFS